MNTKLSLEVIPHGPYCYTILNAPHRPIKAPWVIQTKLCPYWSLNKEKPEQMNGYCSYLEKGDWEDGVDLLWDQVKNCGVNT